MTQENKSPFASVEEAIEEIRQGRHNCARGTTRIAERRRPDHGGGKISPEAINFMAKYGRGLVCLAIADRRPLRSSCTLPLMSPMNTSEYGTAFCRVHRRAALDHPESHADRAATILAAIDPHTQTADLARPGRISTARAQRRRAGSAPGGPKPPWTYRVSRGS